MVRRVTQKIKEESTRMKATYLLFFFGQEWYAANKNIFVKPLELKDLGDDFPKNCGSVANLHVGF